LIDLRCRIAAVIPYYPFKGIDRFYDIQGLLLHPDLLQATVDIFVQRYHQLGIDKIGGFDARGFILGPPIALALKIPFFMLRKSGKLPNALTAESGYTKVRRKSWSSAACQDDAHDQPQVGSAYYHPKSNRSMWVTIMMVKTRCVSPRQL